MTDNSKAQRILSALATVSVLAGMGALMLCGCVTTSWQEDRSIPFSPDDTAIAYRHHNAIYMARTQGERHHKIFTSETAELLSTPHWAPDQRGLAFVSSDGKPDAGTGLLQYTLWYWPAPKEIWESTGGKMTSDSVVLPSDWPPGNPKVVVRGWCRSAVQISSDALFQWHPDGIRIVCLAADEAGEQSVVAVHIESGRQETVSPIKAASLAFSISPDGQRLLCAAVDSHAELAGLWLGPFSSDAAAWRRIEMNPAPKVVPSLELEGKQASGEKLCLYDLRPRLGSWSSDSRWLAHVRLKEGEGVKSDGAADPAQQASFTCALVVTAAKDDGSQQVVPLPDGVPCDLHWLPGGVRVGLLVDRALVLFDKVAGQSMRLAGALRVDHFVGWSAGGRHLAYVAPEDQFRAVYMVLPTLHTVVWGPAERHNLIVAQSDGALPECRFSGMNVTFARWGNKTPKMSFWATYLPTVTSLPRGDPAAVLDVEGNVIKWYPTDVTEYAQVGHYYLLNDEYEKALDHYTESLRKLDETGGDMSLKAQLHLWCGICRLRLQRRAEAADDLKFFRDHAASIQQEGDRNTTVVTNGPTLAKAVADELQADRILLSTMLSMNQLILATQEARRIISEDRDARRLQAQCFLALIDQATSDAAGFTRRVTNEILPGAFASKQISEADVVAMVEAILTIVRDQTNLRRLPVEAKRSSAARLAELSVSVRRERPGLARDLAVVSGIFHREAGDILRELEVLKSGASR